MRTIGEILDMACGGDRPEYDELLYALVAMNALSTFDQMALSKLRQTEAEGKKPFLTGSAVFQFEERFKRMKRALDTDAKVYVGWNNDPRNSECQRRRKISQKIMDRAIQIGESRDRAAAVEAAKKPPP